MYINSLSEFVLGKKYLLFIGFFLVLLITPNMHLYAENYNFKAKEFLTWDKNTQEFYIHTAIGMAGFISLRNDESHGKCLENWYAQDQQTSIDFILQNMQKFPDFHPRGVIIAVLEKQCGSFLY